MALFSELHAEGMTLILVTHDLEVAARPRVVTVKDGFIVSDVKIRRRHNSTMTTMPPLFSSRSFSPPPESTSPESTSPGVDAHYRSFRHLCDAVDIALSQHPEIGDSSAAYERSNLATLRAKLDRFRFSRCSTQELWVKSGIGAASQDSFSGGL